MSKLSKMKQDVLKYPVYFYDEELQEVYKIEKYELLDTYGIPRWNKTRQMHHYIKQQSEDRFSKEFLAENQKLFLLPVYLHEQIHFKAIKNLSDEEFKERFGLSRWEFIFNRKHSNY